MQCHFYWILNSLRTRLCLTFSVYILVCVCRQIMFHWEVFIFTNKRKSLLFHTIALSLELKGRKQRDQVIMLEDVFSSQRYRSSDLGHCQWWCKVMGPKKACPAGPPSQLWGRKLAWSVISKGIIWSKLQCTGVQRTCKRTSQRWRELQHTACIPARDAGGRMGWWTTRGERPAQNIPGHPYRDMVHDGGHRGHGAGLPAMGHLFGLSCLQMRLPGWSSLPVCCFTQ